MGQLPNILFYLFILFIINITKRHFLHIIGHSVSSMLEILCLCVIQQDCHFLEFLETWKCRRIRLRPGKNPKVCKDQRNCVLREI